MYFLLRRLSRALRFFKDTCAMIQRRRNLKVALSTLRLLTRRRPIERAWCHWREIVCHAKSRVVLRAWAAVVKHQRRLTTAQTAISTCRETKLATRLWRLWRRKAGALTLARLLCAWPVIGPVRRALGILQGVAIEARAAEQRRRRQLRCESWLIL